MLLHCLVHVRLRLVGIIVLLNYLVHVRPRLSKSLASQSAQDDIVSAIVFCVIVNVWNCKAQREFLVKIFQRNMFSCSKWIQNFDFAESVADAPDC